MTAKALVEDVYRRYAAGDMDGALSNFAPDMTHRACPNSAGSRFCGMYHGLDAFRGRLVDINDWLSFTRFEPEWIIAEGDIVAARVHVAGVVRATGATLDMTVTHTFRVADGRIVDFEESFDSSYVDAVASAVA